MSAQALTQQLKSSDPKKRFAAIKQIAKNKDASMLKKLAQLAENDPDEQVRAIAARAVEYIQSGGTSGATSAASAEAPAKKREVTISAKDEARAKAYVDSAIDYHIKGERDRALKELSKALSINPNLPRDPFSKSVIEDITGLMGEEALAVIRDPNQIKTVAVSERKLKDEKRKQGHLEVVRRSSWGSVAMDLTIYTLIMIVATALMIVLPTQLAEGFLNGQRQAWAEYNQALADGDTRAKPPEPIDPEFEALAMQLRTLSVPVGLMAGVGSGIASLISLLINLGVTHLAARFIFGGQATFPHLLYRVVSLYNTRLPILYGIIFITLVMTFAVGGGIIPLIGGGAAGLFSLTLFFSTIGRIGEAYDFGAAKGCLSLIVGSFIVGLIGFVIQMLFMGTLMTPLMNQLMGMGTF